MNRQARRIALARSQAGQPELLTPVPADKWPTYDGPAAVVEVWRSRKFLVVLYSDGGFLRVTVIRSALGRGGRFADEITWDELQAIKRDIGRGGQWAVECFPADADLVNVSNMRHLWLLDAPPDFAWRKSAHDLGGES